MSYAKIILSGNMGKGAEFKETKSGTGYLKFSVAVNQWDSSAKEEKPSWFNCQMWDNKQGNRLDRIRPYLEGESNKGKKLVIDGTPSIWQDKEGNNVLTVKVIEIDFGPKDQTKEVKQVTESVNEVFNGEEPPF